MFYLFTKKIVSDFQIIILAFACVILLGGILLMLPVSSAAGLWTPFSEALFTSTSAVCVTGLVVHDTMTYWSVFGKTVILLLIQIGGMARPGPADADPGFDRERTYGGTCPYGPLYCKDHADR